MRTIIYTEKFPIAVEDGAIASPGGGTWDRPKVRGILLNELYVPALVYNRTTQKRQDAHPPQPEGGVGQNGRRMPSCRLASASDNRPTPTPTDDAQPPASPLRATGASSR